jgi:pyruvate/2-oxoglutarate/acetoin dehydrogenase E1 component
MKMTYRDALRAGITEEMERDPTVFVLGEDIIEGCFKVTDGLQGRFGESRVRTTPISEMAIIGGALGASLVGTRPIAEIMFMDFLAVGMDQMVNQVAKMRYMTGGKANTSLVVRTAMGGGRGTAAQHSQCLEAWFMHVPGLEIVMPATPADAKGLIKTAVRSDNPTLFIEHKKLYNYRGEVPEGEYLIPFGKAAVVREGKDLTIIATSSLVYNAVEAAEELAAQGVECEVIDPRTLVPLDQETILASVRKTGRVLIVHEACRRGGIGAELAATIQEEAFDYLDCPIARLGSLGIPVPYSKSLEAVYIPRTEDIISQVKKIMD